MFSSLRRLVSSSSVERQAGLSAQSALASTRSRGRDEIQFLAHDFGTFVQDWEHIHSELTAPDQAALHHGVSRTDLPQRLDRLTQTIVDESLTTDEDLDGMGPCKEYLLRKDILDVLVRAAIADSPSGLLLETVKAFQILVANLDGRFLSQQAVNKPLVRLIRHCVGDEDVDSAWGREAGFDVIEERERQQLDAEQQARMDELLVGLMAFVASKLHDSQELLRIFFHDRMNDDSVSNRPNIGNGQHHSQDPPSSSSDSSTATLKAGNSEQAATCELRQASYDFPLFTYLLRFVHVDGQTGQLARAGLSVILQIAFEAQAYRVTDSLTSSSLENVVRRSGALDLAQYISTSDLPDVLGASLGAIWGLLPSKLAFVGSETGIEERWTAEGGLNLGAGKSDDDIEAEAERLRRLNIESSTSPQVIERLKLFLDILDFVQKDVLARAVQGSSSGLDQRAMASHHLIARLTASIRQSLLENVLSLSMVECGDGDGSAVAIMSFIEVLLSALDDRHPLSDDIMGWFIRQDESYTRSSYLTVLPDAIVRRKSAALLLLEGDKRSRGEEGSYDPLLHYTMKDLIIDYTAPAISDASATAALGLARACFAAHGRLASYGLITAFADDDATAFPYFLPPIGRRSECTDQVRPVSSPSASIPLLDQPDKEPFSFQLNRLTTHLSQHLKQVDLYLSLASALEFSSSKRPPFLTSNCDLLFSTGYSHYLEDAASAVIRDSMYLYGFEHGLTHPPSGLMSGKSSEVQTGLLQSTDDLTYPAFRHRLDPADPLMCSITSRLRQFFEQGPQVNVALTATITAIARCPYRSLAGWLAFEQTASGGDNRTEVEMEEPYDWTQGPELAHRTLESDDWLLPDVPIVLGLLRRLVEHVSHYRRSVQGFDDFLSERRRGLLFADHMNDALTNLGGDAINKEEAIPSATASPTTLRTEKARARLWKSVGWEALGEAELQDVHILDTRAMNLPPRPEDVPSPPTLANRKWDEVGAGATAPLITFTRLFGRSPAAKNKGNAYPRKGEVSVVDQGEARREAEALPFANHYRQTTSITLQPCLVEMPKSRWFGGAAASASLHDNKTKQRNASGTTGGKAGNSKKKTLLDEEEVIDNQSDSGISLGKAEKRTRFRLPAIDGSIHASTSLSVEEAENDRSEKGAQATSSTTGLLAHSLLHDDEGVEEAEEQKFADPSSSSTTTTTTTSSSSSSSSMSSHRNKKRVTLSDLLDNVVILQEFIKELAALLQVRASLGIDPVRTLD